MPLNKKPTSPGAKKAEIEHRRAKVAANLLAGLNYRDIAEALGVSLGTIAADAKAVLKRWQQEQVQSLEARRTVEERRLDRAVNAIWNAVLQGDLAAVDAFRKLSERRSRLIGLDAPVHSKVTLFDAVDQLLQELPGELREQVVALLGGEAHASGSGASLPEMGEGDAS
jgi:hypothetical protein